MVSKLFQKILILASWKIELSLKNVSTARLWPQTGLEVLPVWTLARSLWRWIVVGYLRAIFECIQWWHSYRMESTNILLIVIILIQRCWNCNFLPHVISQIRPEISEKSHQNQLAKILGKILIPKSYQADWVNLKLISVVVYFRLKQFPLRARQIHHQFEVRAPKRWVTSDEGYPWLRSFPVKVSSGFQVISHFTIIEYDQS